MESLQLSNVPLLLQALNRPLQFDVEAIGREAFWYLATPYSHSDANVVRERHALAMSAIAGLHLRGHSIYSPIVHWHTAANKFALPTDAAAWQRENRALLRASGGMLVAIMGGWSISKGVGLELEWALEYDLPVALAMQLSASAPLSRWIVLSGTPETLSDPLLPSVDLLSGVLL